MSVELESAIKKSIQALEYYQGSWDELIKNPYTSDGTRLVLLKLVDDARIAIETLQREFGFLPDSSPPGRIPSNELPNSDGCPEGFRWMIVPEPVRFELNRERNHYLSVQPGTPRYLSAPYELRIAQKIEFIEDEYPFLHLLVLRCTEPPKPS